MTRWGMVIDLRKCIGCETCKHICAYVNFGDWRRVVGVKLNEKKAEHKVFLTMGCMHCNAPPCYEVCPTGATRCRSDGIVEIDKELCTGCGACILACPYKARNISTVDIIPYKKNQGHENPVRQDPDRIGICSKCDFCASRMDEGLKKGLQPGQDFESTPLCVRYCIAEAMVFGDLDDPASEVSKLIRENKTIRLNEELQTDPCVFYIIK
jgi:phenylacetyl-CoA:acceptor oxidoreductase subunit 1